MNVFSVSELSGMMRVTEKTIRRYLKSGHLKGAKIARKWLVHEDALKELLGVTEQSQNKTASDTSKDHV